MNFIKPLPYNEEAEQAVLASIIVDNEILEPFFDEFPVEIFYNETNLKTMESIFELHNDGKPIDLITLNQKKGIDLEYLINITSTLPTSANWYAYAKILENCYKRRELILESRRIENNAYNSENNIEDFIENSFKNINTILNTGASKALDNEEVLKNIDQYISDCSHKGLIGYSWGIDFLDQYTSGIRKGKLYRITGKSNIGKTNLFYNTIPILLSQGAKVMFVSLENTVESTYIKIMSSVIGKNPNDIEKGREKFDRDWVMKYKDQLIITDKLSDFDEIKREILKNKPDIVLLDYVQLVEVKGIYNEIQRLDAYAKGVKKFIQNNQDIAWVDLSQVAMNAEDDFLIQTGNFKGSSELKNTIDFGLLLLANKKYLEAKNAAVNLDPEMIFEGKEYKNRVAIDFHITKNRLSSAGTAKTFGINFDNGIRYKEIPREVMSSWN